MLSLPPRGSPSLVWALCLALIGQPTLPSYGEGAGYEYAPPDPSRYPDLKIVGGKLLARDHEGKFTYTVRIDSHTGRISSATREDKPGREFQLHPDIHEQVIGYYNQILTAGQLPIDLGLGGDPRTDYGSHPDGRPITEAEAKIAAINYLFNSLDSYSHSTRPVAYVNRVKGGVVKADVQKMLTEHQLATLLEDNPYDCTGFHYASSAYQPYQVWHEAYKLSPGYRTPGYGFLSQKPIPLGFLMSRALDPGMYRKLLNQKDLRQVARDLGIDPQLSRKDSPYSKRFVLERKTLVGKSGKPEVTHDSGIAFGLQRVWDVQPIQGHGYSGYSGISPSPYGTGGPPRYFYMSFDTNQFLNPGRDTLLASSRVVPLDFKKQAREAIYELPNGMHAYLLSDANGNLANEAPASIVKNTFATDPRWMSERFAFAHPDIKVISSPLNCITCHSLGTVASSGVDIRADLKKRSAEGTVFTTHGVKGSGRETLVPLSPYDLQRAMGIYGGIEEAKKFMEATNQRLRTAQEYGGAFIPNPLDPTRAVPVAADLAVKYQMTPVTYAQAARELNVDEKDVESLMKSDARLRRAMGIDENARPPTIERHAFESFFCTAESLLKQRRAKPRTPPAPVSYLARHAARPDISDKTPGTLPSAAENSGEGQGKPEPGSHASDADPSSGTRPVEGRKPAQNECDVPRASTRSFTRCHIERDIAPRFAFDPEDLKEWDRRLADKGLRAETLLFLKNVLTYIEGETFSMPPKKGGADPAGIRDGKTERERFTTERERIVKCLKTLRKEFDPEGPKGLFPEAK